MIRAAAECCAVLVLFCTVPLTEEEAGEKVLFEDDFAGKLKDGWSWVREERDAWRLGEKGLEIRIRPGNMWGRSNNAKNLLKREAPGASRDAVAAQVTVTNEPASQYEQAGITWYFDDGNMVKLVREQVDGKVHVVMGREEDDRTRTIALLAKEGKSYDLRLRVKGNVITGFYRVDGTDPWQEAGSCELPAAEGPAQVCLQAYNGPADAERWALFSRFSIRRVGS